MAGGLRLSRRAKILNLLFILSRALFVGGLSVSSSAEAKGARESCPFSRLRAFVIDFSLHVCVFLSVSLPTKGIFVALSSLLRADLHFCRLVVGSFIQNQARG